MFFQDSPRLQLGFAGANGCSIPHLSVDGMTPVGPNLSHWPGNRTPGKWKADLSTGIALQFARASATEQEEFLGASEFVLNDHYDTDGFGALLAVLRPEVAIGREELRLTAAAVGDYGTWQTWRGFAIDRTIARIGAPESPVHAVFRRWTDPDQRTLERYRWLIENAESVLDGTGQFAALYAEEMAAVRQQLQEGLGGAVGRRSYDPIGFSVLTSRGDRHRMVLNTLAGAFRILHVRHEPDGTRFRYHDRTESWFELVTLRPLPRLDLRPIAAYLDSLEAPHDGACWLADPPSEPIPELYFGVPSVQAYGQLTRELRPSNLPPERVEAALVRFFAEAQR